MDVLEAFALVGWAAVVGAAWRWRSRLYAVFALVVLSFPVLVGTAVRPHLGAFGWTVPYFQLASFVHFAALIFVPAMRPWAFRTLVSIPALWFSAACFLALPWSIAAGLGADVAWVWLPFALCALGVVQSLWTREETVDVVLDGAAVDGLRRHPGAVDRRGRLVPRARALEIVQITDPHLGPFMSVERLRAICERAVERDPDLVLVTGDLMTMESHDVDVVAAALAPLRALEGRVFACHGNHDHEARDVVARALHGVGARLLVDEETVVATRAGRVQILGADFVWRHRAAHLRALCERFPRRGDALRLVMLHDPGAFRHLPEGEGDLVLSGHTHGGQVGLVSLGLPWTFLSLTKIPDHGLWARGRDRLYVHRAHGHYGFPIRLGVPAENSLLRVHRS
jgi:predicted MPP superfamily phosphohydrolase